MLSVSVLSVPTSWFLVVLWFLQGGYQLKVTVTLRPLAVTLGLWAS